MADINKITAFVFAQEGGYQANPRDPGNWTGGRAGVGVLVGTNMGISAPVLAGWRHQQVVLAADMQDLSRAEATAIAGALFGNPLRVEQLPAGVDLMAFELAWGSGLYFGATTLQRAVGAAVDGFVGPETVALAQAADPRTVIAAMDAASRVKYRAQATFPEFGDGWMARADRRLAAALAMVPTTAANEATA